MTTIAIACTADIYALLFSRLSGREGPNCKIGVARIECSNTQRQHCEEERDDGKRPLATFHGSTPFSSRRPLWAQPYASNRPECRLQCAKQSVQCGDTMGF